MPAAVRCGDGLAPYLYRDVRGAAEVHRSDRLHPGGAPGAKAQSAELRLSGAHLMVVRENPRRRDAPRADWPRSPVSAGAASVFLTVHVDDMDAVQARALAAAALPALQRDAVQDGYRGDRIVPFHDPFGHVWRIMARLDDVDAMDPPERCEAQRKAGRAARGLA